MLLNKDSKKIPKNQNPIIYGTVEPEEAVE
jgi:hypothetical protein